MQVIDTARPVRGRASLKRPHHALKQNRLPPIHWRSDSHGGHDADHLALGEVVLDSQLSGRFVGGVCLRNALVSVVTVIGLTLPVLFGGSVIIEMIFQWPGIGLMFISAVTGRDSPVIMGYVLFSAVMVQVCNLLTDLAYSFLDPRIRYD